jgi:hypothetical protein
MSVNQNVDENANFGLTVHVFTPFLNTNTTESKRMGQTLDFRFGAYILINQSEFMILFSN